MSTTSLPLETERKGFGSVERTAWLVLLGSLSVCMLLAIGVPLTGWQYFKSALVPMQATVQAASITPAGGSTIRARLCGVPQPIAITADGVALPECSTVQTDPSSKAFITFFDGSTVTLSTDTTLVLQQMSSPKFAASPSPNTIIIQQQKGSARYGAAPSIARGNQPARPLDFTVKTPQMTVRLTPGSYSVEVDASYSEVSVREGQAIVSNSEPNRFVFVGQGQSLTAYPGKPLPESSVATKNLIRSGDFTSDTLGKDWTEVHDQGGDGGALDGTIQVVTIGNRRAIQILRTGSENNSAETGIRQVIDRDVSDFRTLQLKADVRLHYQDLPGGGYLSTEYPLLLLLRYRDVNNNEQDWVHGFYYQNEGNNPTLRGELYPRDVWVPYESGNLLAGIKPRPFRILWIKIYASGWDYESYVSGVQLLAE